MKYLILTLFMLFAASTASIAQTCGVTTKAGTACSRKVSKIGEHCWQHGGQTKAEKAGTVNSASLGGGLSSQSSSLCGAPTKAGTPCKNRVKGGGYCHLHKG